MISDSTLRNKERKKEKIQPKVSQKEEIIKICAFSMIINSDRERQIPYDIVYMQNLKKNDTNGLIYKTEINSQT